MPHAQRDPLRFTLATQDPYRWVTRLSVGGLTVAVLLALVGGFPLDLPMPTHGVGVVTPTCGLTRGSTALARGDLTLAWQYNPASLLVIAAGALGIARAITGWVTGRWVTVTGRLPRRWWVAAVPVVLVLWAHQQTNADFIIHSRL